MKKIVLIIILSLLAAGFLAWLLSRRDSTQGSIRVGVLLPLTGDASSYGQKGRKAIEMAVDDCNAGGNAGSKKIVAIFEDSKSNAKDGVSAVQKLITIDKVPAVVGDALSAVTLPASAVAEANQVVLLSPVSSAPALTQAGKYIYRIWPSDLLEGKAAAEYAISRDFKRAALLYVNNDYGSAIADIFSKQFTSDVRKVVLKSAYADTTTDWRAIVTPLASAGPDVVYVAGYYKDTAAILRTATELGIRVQFIGTTAIEDENLIKLAAGAAEGIVYPLATSYDTASTNPITRAFIDSFQKRFGYEPGWMEAHAYDAFMLVCKAARAGGGVSGTQIRDYFDTMGVYQGVTGEIKFDENGDVIKKVVFKTVKDGHFVLLVK